MATKEAMFLSSSTIRILSAKRSILPDVQVLRSVGGPVSVPAVQIVPAVAVEIDRSLGAAGDVRGGSDDPHPGQPASRDRHVGTGEPVGVPRAVPHLVGVVAHVVGAGAE